MAPPAPPPLPALAAPLRPVTPPPRPALAPGERLLPTIAAAGVVTVLGDFLFWGYTPGLSLAIFAVALAVLLLVKNGRATAHPLLAFGLLIVSAVQTAIEISFTNCAVIVALFAVLMGELYFKSLPASWPRWSESLAAWLCAFGRWAWLIAAVNEKPLLHNGTATRLGDRLVRSIRIALPAIALLVLFAAVFASGNRIFSVR